MSQLESPIRKNDNVLVIAGKDRGKRGRVLKVVPAKNRLVVEGVRGEVLVPLVPEICTTIDVPGKRIVIEPPEGLLDLNA